MQKTTLMCLLVFGSGCVDVYDLFAVVGEPGNGNADAARDGGRIDVGAIPDMPLDVGPMDQGPADMLGDADEIDQGRADALALDAAVLDAEPDAMQPDAAPACYVCDPQFAADVPCTVDALPALAPPPIPCRHPAQPTGEPELAIQLIDDVHRWLDDPVYQVELVEPVFRLTHQAPAREDWETVEVEFDAQGRVVSVVLMRNLDQVTYRLLWRDGEAFVVLEQRERIGDLISRNRLTPDDDGGWSWSERYESPFGYAREYDRWTNSWYANGATGSEHSQRGGEGFDRSVTCGPEGFLYSRSHRMVIEYANSTSSCRDRWGFVDGQYRSYVSYCDFSQHGFVVDPMLWFDEARALTHVRYRSNDGSIQILRRGEDGSISYADEYRCRRDQGNRDEPWCGFASWIDDWEYDPPAEPEGPPDRRICYTDLCRVEVPCE